MKRQTLALKLKKASEKQMILSASLFLTLINGTLLLPVQAQSVNYDSYLPPEVVPINPAINYNIPTTANAQANAQMNVPASVSQPSRIPDTRQGMPLDQLAQNTNQLQSLIQSRQQEMATQSMPSQSPNQAMPQTLGHEMVSQPLQPQTLSNQMSAQNNMTNVANMPMNMANNTTSQTQMLSGTVQSTAATQPRTSGGFSHLASMVTGFGLCGIALAGMRSPGGIYSAGLLGGSMMNYGMLNGFRF